MALQSAPSSPEEFTPSSASTTESPWTRWPPSAERFTPPSLLPASPLMLTCSLSSRWGPDWEEPFSVCWTITSGRSSSTFTTLTEVRVALWGSVLTGMQTYELTFRRRQIGQSEASHCQRSLENQLARQSLLMQTPYYAGYMNCL